MGFGRVVYSGIVGMLLFFGFEYLFLVLASAINLIDVDLISTATGGLIQNFGDLKYMIPPEYGFIVALWSLLETILNIFFQKTLKNL